MNECFAAGIAGGFVVVLAFLILAYIIDTLEQGSKDDKG